MNSAKLGTQPWQGVAQGVSNGLIGQGAERAERTRGDTLVGLVQRIKAIESGLAAHESALVDTASGLGHALFGPRPAEPVGNGDKPACGSLDELIGQIERRSKGIHCAIVELRNLLGCQP